MTEVPAKVQQAYGQLPCGWQLEKLKFFADVRNSNVDKTVVDGEEPVWLCNYTDVYYNSRITPDLEFMQGSATQVEIEKFQLKHGQVIITKDSEGWDDIGIPALVTEDMPGVLCGYHLSILEPTQELDSGFLAWSCRSEPLNNQFKLGANGITRYGLGQYPMKNAFIAIPPLETQQRIARFLDEKTARIDALIEKKRALLERLAEKRQALITRAVTKGLNPDAPMKASGIDWLGDIPAHWDSIRVRYVSDFVTSGSRGWAEFYSDEGSVFLRITNVTSNSIKLLLDDVQRVSPPDTAEGNRTATRGGDVVVSITADLGSVAVVPEGYESAYVSQHLALVRPNTQKISGEWLAYQVFSSACQAQLLGAGYGGTKIQLGLGDIKDLWLAIPSLAEQRKITLYLGSTINAIDQQLSLVDAAIERLQEYRSALITAAVTGQLAELN